MSTTSRNKNLIFIIAVLLLTNIAVLGYFLWFKKPGQPRHQPNRALVFMQMLQKEVGFTDTQLEQYKQLKDQRREAARPMFDEMRKAKENLFKLVSDSTVSDSAIQATANIIAEQQKALDIETLNHFKKIRALCNTAEQQVKYDSAVLRMIRKMGKPIKKADTGKEEKN